MGSDEKSQDARTRDSFLLHDSSVGTGLAKAQAKSPQSDSIRILVTTICAVALSLFTSCDPRLRDGSENSTQESLGTLEDRVAKAKSIVLEFSFRMQTNEGGRVSEVLGNGLLLIKRPNKVFLRMERKEIGSNVVRKDQTVCNGSKLKTLFGDLPELEVDAPESFATWVARVLVRVGAWQASAWGLEPRDPYLVYEVIDKSPVVEEKGSRSVEYLMRIKGVGGLIHSIIRVDSKSGNMLGRTDVQQFGNSSCSVTEKYEKFELNSAIPDERFRDPD